MLFTKIPPLNILPCGACHSLGSVGVRRCKECRGMSMGHLTREKFLYWGEPFTPYHIALRKGRRYLNSFRLLGALIFGLSFLVLFVFNVYQKQAFDLLLTADFWLLETPLYQSFFWLSAIAFSYLAYRLILVSGPRDEVETLGYKQKLEEVEVEQEQLQTWDMVNRLSRKKKKDIAQTFTVDSKQTLEEAYRIALKNQSDAVTPLHVFYALLSSPKISTLFIRLGIPPSLIQTKVNQMLPKGETSRVPLLAPEVEQILFQAYDEAYRVHQPYVYVTEILMATVRQSEALQELLYDVNVGREKLANVVEWVRIRERLYQQYRRFRKVARHRSKYGLDRAMTAVATPYLNQFSEDVTLAAKFGYLAPCVARDKEIEEIFRIIEGGRQSVILVGDHGVGKMSIIEGIAQCMVAEVVPTRLHDKRLVQLSTSALLAGATVSGAQERLIHMMNEIAKARNVILFIKNIHDLIGATQGEGEGLDVSETLAEYLGPGKFLTFATTSPVAYNRYITNTEMGTVFARVDIKAMDENQAIQVLEAKAGNLEYKHNVFFSYDAVAQAVHLAERFLHEQNLPDSAIEVISEAASLVRNQKGENQLVTAEDVAAIISAKTGIPVTSISEAESVKLLRLEEEMHKQIIGQDEAVSMVANALRRARAEIRSTKKPIANFLFLGPTGVGKTELAKTMARVYFGSEDRMIRLDMSEYQDKASIYRLIGQTGQPGTGLLTEAVRQHPFSLLLLDEMEKADPDVLNLFLQVFDDGRLTDSVGRVIDFTNTIIIATSNAGTAYVQSEIVKGTSLETIRQKLMREELKQYYRPEFLNRFDGIVLFKPLGREEIKRVADLMLKRVAKDLETRGVELRVEPAALDALAEVGFDPEFGARPMRRAIQDRIENELAELVLAGKLKRRDIVVLGANAEIRVEHV